MERLRWPLALGLVGCGSGPLPGEWVYVTGELVENSCDLSEADVVPVGTFYVRDDGDLLTFSDGSSDTFTCSLDGQSFTCDDEPPFEIVLTANATLVVALRIDGTFESARAGSATQTLDGACEGSDCAFAGAIGLEFPCTSTLVYDFEWVSADLGPLDEG